MRNAIAIMGIHTGIGKTIVSAVIAEALRMDYWKPIQAGELASSDSIKVRSLISNEHSVVHPEAFQLTQPLSPHEAARIDGLTIEYKSIPWPAADRPLLVETAGGILSPINDESTMLDFVAHYQLPVVLVVRHYLGSINHTMMSLDVLKNKKIVCCGMVISGEPNLASQHFIINNSSVPLLTTIPEMVISRQTISAVADVHRASLLTLLDYVNP